MRLWIKLKDQVVTFVTKQLDIMKKNTTERFNLRLLIVESKQKRSNINARSNNSFDVMSSGQVLTE